MFIGVLHEGNLKSQYSPNRRPLLQMIGALPQNHFINYNKFTIDLKHVWKLQKYNTKFLFVLTYFYCQNNEKVWKKLTKKTFLQHKFGPSPVFVIGG